MTADLPDIASGSEEGFCDLSFALASHAARPDGSQEVVARGTHRGATVGFTAVILPKWAPWQVEGLDKPLYKGGVTIDVDGPSSHAFVAALGELYGVPQPPASMARRIFFAGIALAGYPPALQTEAVKIKLFFEADVEERYAEVYLNIDVGAARVEFAEKYRRPLVRALSGG